MAYFENPTNLFAFLRVEFSHKIFLHHFRLCTRCCCKKEQNTKFHPRSGNKDTSTPNSSNGSVIIEIPEMKTLEKKSCSVKGQLGDAISVKSLFVTIPQVKDVVPTSASVLW